MAWRRPGDKPLSEPRMICLPTHICVTRPQLMSFKDKPPVTATDGFRVELWCFLCFLLELLNKHSSVLVI